MKQKNLFPFIFGLVFLWAGTAGAMSSNSFKITPMVISGGGGQMASGSFSTLTVLGQPSPVMESGMEPSSTQYYLYPGYIYTFAAGSFCSRDNDQDGDVDGLDLYEFTNPFDSTHLGEFVDQFGRTDCF